MQSDTTRKLETSNLDSSRLSPRLRLILVVVLIADVLDLMDSTITNIAAPTIVREIGGEEGLVKWLGAGHALAIGVLLVVGSRLGDRFGKRRMFLIGIAGFGLASVWCGLSVDPAMLVAGRLVQGGFGAVLIPQGIGLLLKTFSREQFPAAMTAFGPVLAGSAVLGPIVAGFIISANVGGLTCRRPRGLGQALNASAESKRRRQVEVSAISLVPCACSAWRTSGRRSAQTASTTAHGRSIGSDTADQVQGSGRPPCSCRCRS